MKSIHIYCWTFERNIWMNFWKFPVVIPEVIHGEMFVTIHAYKIGSSSLVSQGISKRLILKLVLGIPQKFLPKLLLEFLKEFYSRIATLGQACILSCIVDSCRHILRFFPVNLKDFGFQEVLLGISQTVSPGILQDVSSKSAISGKLFL